MNYKVVLTHSFKQSVKRLGKRFRHVKEDVRTAIEVLDRTPNLDVLIPNGFEIRKLRVANSDLAKGKSGGYRLLYQLTESPEPRLNLLLLYAKFDQADVTKDELRQLLDDLTEEPNATEAVTDDSPANTD